MVEEITRIYGYDNITPKSIEQPVKPALLDNAIKLEYDTKLTLAERFDLNETHSYIWYDLACNNLLNINPTSVIRCVNSINKENDKIRSTMIPSLLKVIIDNKNHFNEIGTFEIGRVVKNLKEDNLVDERKSLGLVLYNKDNELEKTLLKLKEILNYLFEYIYKLDMFLILTEPNISYYHPKNYYKIMINENEIGDIFTLHINSSEKIKENCTVVGFEIDFSKLVNIKCNEVKFEKISKYPTTKLDFSFLIPKNCLYKDIIGYAKTINTNLNYKVSLLDIYDNENDELKTYTLHYEVNSLERTLTSQDIENFHTAVINKFKENDIEIKL